MPGATRLLASFATCSLAGWSSHLDGGSATCLELDGGPLLIVPYQQVPVGCRLSVAIRAEEVLLARGPIAGGLSARNIMPGTVARILPHQREAEVIVRTGNLDWIVSVVEPALAALDLRPGVEVHLVVKARSCHVLGGSIAAKSGRDPLRRQPVPSSRSDHESARMTPPSLA